MGFPCNSRKNETFFICIKFVFYACCADTREKEWKTFSKKTLSTVVSAAAVTSVAVSTYEDFARGSQNSGDKFCEI